MEKREKIEEKKKRKERKEKEKRKKGEREREREREKDLLTDRTKHSEADERCQGWRLLADLYKYEKE